MKKNGNSFQYSYDTLKIHLVSTENIAQPLESSLKHIKILIHDIKIFHFGEHIHV